MSRVVVLGGAESGVGAAVLAKVKGFDVFLSDKGKIADKYIETLKEVAGGQQNKTVYLPYEASNLLGSLGGIKELLGK